MSVPTATGHANPPGDGGPPEIPDHTLLCNIGAGSYGEVWLARSALGAYRAVKIVHRSSFDHDRPYEREFGGIQKFEPVSRTHEGLVDILQAGRNDEKGYFYYVMELADDEFAGQKIDPATYVPLTLSQTVNARRRLPFEECVRLSLSLASAVGHLHRHGLVHRDIKPSNIIFVNGAPKLADIGLVTTVGAKSIPGGTLGYIAPEGEASPKADIYALGKVLYEITTGKDRQEFPELPTVWDAHEPAKLSELNEVILKACEAKPAERYESAADMEADLVLLQRGKSVKRLRALERRVVLLTRAALAVALLALVAGAAYYQVHRSRKEATERLASEYIRTGTDSMEKGDTFKALLRFTEALHLHEGDAHREGSDRVRLATALRRCPRLLRMWFQDKTLNDVAFSPDGRRVVTAGGGGLVFLRDLEGAAPARQLIGHRTDKEIESAAFDPTGEFLATAGTDQTVRVWETATGRELAMLPHTNTVYSAHFSPDGRQLLTAAGARARIWDWRNTNVLRLLTGHTGSIREAVFSPDGRRVVTASADKTARLWNADTGEQAGPPLPHGARDQNWVYSAAFSPDGTRVATGCFDNEARIWDVATGKLEDHIPHDGGVRSVEFSPDGRYLLVACWDYTTRLWDLATRQPVGPPLKSAHAVNRARFSPDGTRLITGDWDGVVCVWALPPINWRPPTLQAAFSADGRRYSVLVPGGVEVRDAASDAPLCSVISSGAIQKTFLSADGSRLLAVSTNTDARGLLTSRAQLWNVASTQALSAPFPCGLDEPGRGATVKASAQLSRDGARFANAVGKLAQVWETATGQPAGPPLAFTNSINEICFSPDGRSLGAVVGRSVFVGDVGAPTNRLVLTHDTGVEHAEFSPDGGRLVTACQNVAQEPQPAQVWDAFTGRPIGTPLLHSDGITWASFSPDGRRVTTASEDFTARIWDAATGARRKPQLRHRHQVWFSGFSPDGRWVLTASQDLTARVWDAESGDPITPPLRHVEPPSSAQFVAGGRRIVTRRRSGDTWIWDLPADDRSAADLIQMTQLLFQHHGDEGNVNVVLPLDRETLRGHWKTLSARYPADFAITPAETLAWHEREADEAERAGQWSAALFHLDRLIAGRPGDSILQQRRNQIFARNQDARNGAF